MPFWDGIYIWENYYGKEIGYEYFSLYWVQLLLVSTIKDDYEQILVKMIQAEQIWLIADTKYGFVSYQAKNVIDRIMLMVTMYLKMKNGQIRHVMRYKKWLE